MKTTKRLTIKNQHAEKFLFHSRLLWVIVFMAICVLILWLRFVALQIAERSHYQTLSDKNTITLVPLPPPRGLIYDRNGVLLAENIPVFNLVYHSKPNIPLTKALADIQQVLPLSQNDLAQFQLALQTHRPFQTVPLKMKLSEKDRDTFEVNAYRFPEFSIQAASMRYYPQGKIMAHALGYVGRMNMEDDTNVDLENYAGTDDIGKIGLERYFENTLHGTVGYQKIEINAQGQIVRVLSRTPPIAGQNLYLTLDSQLQKVGYNALKKYRGALIAINPQNGDVLAFISTPSYNPNPFVRGISQKQFSALLNDPNHPLYNRTIRGLYPPGSTFKPFVALAGLNAGVITPDYRIFDPGYFKLPDSTHIYHDWLLTGHGWVTVHNAIVESCDTYFYNLAHILGIEPIDDMLTAFGFGQPTHIEMEEELSGAVASPAYKLAHTGLSWFPGDTVITGIGQGFTLMTPLQLAKAVATLSTRGIGYQPHLLLGTQTAHTQTLTLETPVALTPVVLKSPDIWQVVIDAMVGVIRDPGGTGYHFGTPAYSVGAKTGTAQLRSLHGNMDQALPESERDNSVFIAFAPVDHPVIAVAVFVENNADAPKVARIVMDQYLLTEHHWNQS